MCWTIRREGPYLAPTFLSVANIPRPDEIPLAADPHELQSVYADPSYDDVVV